MNINFSSCLSEIVSFDYYKMIKYQNLTITLNKYRLTLV